MVATQAVEGWVHALLIEKIREKNSANVKMIE